MKNWTILIYANGNNEMEIEMHQSILLCEKIGSSKDINIVVQLSKANNKLVNIMRPKKDLPVKYPSWLGSRRYYISKSESILLKNLGEINMADPKNLYDFLRWGVENYPAKHYMVVLGGHGISFIGNMTDLTGKIPYMMGTPEMCKVLLNVSQDLNINIDSLVLDMCYMNSIEVIYELSHVENNPIKTMLTYIDEGPFQGLPYDTIISTIDKYSSLEDINILTKNIIKSINLDLVAFTLNSKISNNIKSKFNELALLYSNNKSRYNLQSITPLKYNDSIYPWYNTLFEVNELLSSIIIDYNQPSNNGKSLIQVITDDISDFIPQYFKLTFSINNHWASILCNFSVPKNLEEIRNYELIPINLSKKGVLYSILAYNPDISEHEAYLILDNLFST